MDSETYAEFHRVRATLSEREREDVDYFHGQAIGYVWGYQDAGGRLKDSTESFDFGSSYGLHCAMFALGVISCRHSIQSAFDAWRDGRPIGTYAQELAAQL